MFDMFNIIKTLRNDFTREFEITTWQSQQWSGTHFNPS